MNTFTGNVGSVELKFTPGGKAVLEVNFAENHSKKVNGEWQEDGTTWRRASLWEDKAEAAADFIKKGDKIVVVGRERLREYEAKDGTKGKSLEVAAQIIAKVPPRLQQGQPQQSQSWGGQQPAQSWGGTPNNDAQNWGAPNPAF